MDYILICAAVLIGTYLISITYMSVFYHRAFTHEAIRLRPWFRRFVIWSGPWVTGMDIKAWVCMHRLHHEHSDTTLDPHSPVNTGMPGVLLAQVRYYETVCQSFRDNDGKYEKLVADLDIPLSWFQRRKNRWWLPYAVHSVIGLGLAVGLDAWLLGSAYVFGIISHPIQGWIINAYGHARGYRNFDRKDNSRNHYAAAFFILGEGYQNNHHQYPASAKFSFRAWEIDFGYVICRALALLGMLQISAAGMIPRASLPGPIGVQVKIP